MLYSLLVLGFLVAGSEFADVEPRLPYLDWGACPSECCEYGTWTANSRTRILKYRRNGSSVAFELEPGESVQGLTGVVVTTRTGEVKVFRATEVGRRRHKVSAGETFPLLRYQGEGYWKFWLQGQPDSDQLPDINDTASDSELDLRVVSWPETIWWVKVKNRRGQVGWTSETLHFDHVDTCE